MIPGGSSVRVLPRHICDNALMDFDDLASYKSGLGTAAVIVMNEVCRGMTGGGWRRYQIGERRV